LKEGNMKICDLSEEDVKIGLKVKSLKNGQPGVITDTENRGSETIHTITWEDGNTSGFYWNDCECEIIE
jgi:hypothetical protein